MFRKHLSLNFGQFSVEEIFKGIFIIGTIPILFMNLIMSTSVNSFFSFSLSLNIQSVIGFLIYILCLGFSILLTTVIWKLVCELLFLIFKSLEIYIMKNR